MNIFSVRQETEPILKYEKILDIGLQILDLWYSADFIKMIERSDSTNPKSTIHNHPPYFITFFIQSAYF